MTSKLPTIIIVDDDFSIMRCVGIALEREESIRVVGQTTHAQAGIAMARHTNPDLVLLDIHMPGADPFEACAKIVREPGQPARVLYYTAFPKDQYLDRAIAAGASGIVSKHTESVQNLGLAIRHVVDGSTYFSPELTRRLVELEEGVPRSRLSALTHREIEVLRGVADGKTQPQIATEIGVSERTVHMEVAHVKEKLALSTTHELLMFAINEGLAFPELQPT